MIMLESRLVALVLLRELITVTSLRRLHPLIDKEVNVILWHASRDHLSAQSRRQRTDFLSALRFLGTLKEAHLGCLHRLPLHVFPRRVLLAHEAMVILSNGRLRCVVVRMPMPLESRCLVALVLHGQGELG